MGTGPGNEKTTKFLAALSSLLKEVIVVVVGMDTKFNFINF